MNKVFGTKFIVVNDIVQPLNPKVFGGGKWIHLATVQRGLREYIAFKKEGDNHVYVEIIDPHELKFQKIKDDNEWKDIVAFLTAAGLLGINNTQEKLIGRKILEP